MPENEGSRWPAILGILFLIGTAILAFMVLLAPDSSEIGSAPAHTASGGFLTQRPAGRRPPAPRRRQKSGLDLIDGRSLAKQAAEARRRRQAAARTPARAAKRTPAPRQAPLSEEERSTYDRAMGRYQGWAATRKNSPAARLFVKTIEKAFDHPRALKAVLDNPLVIAAFFKSRRAQRNCKNPQAFADFLSDSSDPTGISLYTEGFRRSLDKPGATTAIVTSGLAKKVLTECSAIGGVTRNQALVGQVAKENPQVLLLLADPRLVSALVKNPTAMRVVTDANSSRTAGR